jgi:hypothetical protein
MLAEATTAEAAHWQDVTPRVSRSETSIQNGCAPVSPALRSPPPSNGYHQPREVLTSAGVIEMAVRRVNDERTDPQTGS